MKKKLLKFFIIIGALALLLTLINTTRVQAVLQSNPNTHYKKTDGLENWMSFFRDMEATGAALGLKETKYNDQLIPSSESNNLDSHMMKSTEYGAIAILSASGYGNPTTLQKSTIKTTTGNETGLYYNGSTWEWVAGKYGTFSGVNARYYDAYTASNTSAKVGDALGTGSTTNPGSAGWHSASYSNWVSSPYPYFLRGYGGLFAFNNYYYAGDDHYCGRGVVVCGAGL